MRALSLAVVTLLFLATPVLAGDESGDGNPESAERDSKEESKEADKQAKDEEKEAKHDDAQEEANQGTNQTEETEGARSQEAKGSEPGQSLLVQSCTLIANHIGDQSVPKTQWIIVDPQGCVKDTVRKIIERPLGLGR